jgi:putative phage-type endonuclease
MTLILKGRKVDLVQNTKPWLAWRKLGGSDSAVLMSVNPWCDIRLLWERKLGLVPDAFETAPQKAKEAMQRGHDLEPEARLALELETGLKLPAACYEHVEYSFITASVDGISSNEKVISEIKCPGLKTHMEALAGKVPPYYFVQCQHNMGATGAELCLYFSYTNVKDVQQTKLIEIPQDEEYIQRIIGRCRDFWPYIESRTPPDLARFGVKDAGSLNGDIRTDPAFKKAVEELMSARNVLLDAQAQYDLRESRISELMQRKKQVVAISNGIRIERIYKDSGWETLVSTEMDEQET